jgi:hypothetical protein
MSNTMCRGCACIAMEAMDEASREAASLRADLAREQALRHEAEAELAGLHRTFDAQGDRLKAALDDLAANARCEFGCRESCCVYSRADMRDMHRRAQAAESRAIKAERQAEAQRDAERAKVRRVMERCREVIGNGFATGTQRAVLAADILAIIEEESGR